MNIKIQKIKDRIEYILSEILCISKENVRLALVNINSDDTSAIQDFINYHAHSWGCDDAPNGYATLVAEIRILSFLIKMEDS